MPSFKSVVTFMALFLLAVTAYELVSWTVTIKQVFGK